MRPPFTPWRLAREWADRAAAMGLPADPDADVAAAWPAGAETISAAEADEFLDRLEGRARAALPAWRMIEVDGAPALVADLRARPPDRAVVPSTALEGLRDAAVKAWREAMLDDLLARPTSPDRLARRWGVGRSRAYEALKSRLLKGPEANGRGGNRAA